MAHPPYSGDMHAPPVVLLTGFEPFGGSPVNPSALAVRALEGRIIAGHRVVTAELPTVFGQSLEVLQGLVRRHAPRVVLCCGQAGGRPAISLERVAINVDDARIPDNAGAQPVDRPVVAGGPAAYFTTLPIKAMLRALRDAGIAAEVSQTAGTFVCNHVFYGLMHMMADRADARVRGGLVHVPWMPGQGEPSMPLETVTEALAIAIGCALLTRADIPMQAGALD
jgi:pyroglutamyl-peptidase